jgi:hypothetical protein
MPEFSAIDQLDDGLRRVAAALVAEAPEPPDLFGEEHDGVGGVATLAGGAARRPGSRRRVVVGAAAAAVLVLAAAGVAVIAGGGPASDVAVRDQPADPALAAPQRLLLRNWWGELGADGEPVKLELAGLDPHGSPRPLPGGGHVVVGIHPVEEPVPAGFDEMTDLIYGLAVVDAGGDVVTERRIEPSTLVGATATEAILSRGVADDPGGAAGPRQIVAQNLVTGDERVVREDAPTDPEQITSGDTAVIGDQLVTVEVAMGSLPSGGGTGASRSEPESHSQPEDCVLRTTDLTTGAQSEQPVELGCGMVVGVQPSPDGARLAVTYEPRPTAAGDFGVHLAVVGVPSGVVTQDEVLGDDVVCSEGAEGCPSGRRPVRPLGAAWQTDTTLRVAMVDLATNPDWNFDEDDLHADQLLVDTIPVG